MSEKNKKTLFKNYLKKIGKNPEQDWVIIIFILVVLVFIGVTFSVVVYYKTGVFIKNALEQVKPSVKNIIKTKEEELREIINVYVTRSAVHNTILGQSNLLVEINVATTTATTTNVFVATTTSSSVSTTTIPSFKNSSIPSSSIVDPKISPNLNI